MIEPAELRFRGFEQVDTWRLRAAFTVTDAAGREFTAYADLDRAGHVLDLQASDTAGGGTTGRPAIDVLVSRRAQAELVRARAALVVATFDRPRRRYIA